MSIHCQGQVFKAHKVIVCGQSKFFANAVRKEGFKVTFEGAEYLL
jgi:hypothetical protein